MAERVRDPLPPSIRLESGMHVPVDVFRLLTRNLERAKHTLILGPTGIGKTRLAIEIAEHMGRPCQVFFFGGILDVEAAMIGTTIFRDGRTRFVRSRFVDAVETPGCVIVLDELSRAGGTALNVLLSLLDFQRRAAVDLDEGDRRIVHLAPGAVVVATANVGSQYVAVEPLDLALLNRFLCVRLGYPENEQALLQERGVQPATAARLVRIAQAIRRQHDAGELEATVSVRNLLEVGELVKDGIDVEEAFVAAVGVLEAAAVAALRAIVRATP